MAVLRRVARWVSRATRAQAQSRASAPTRTRTQDYVILLSHDSSGFGNAA